MSYLGAYHEDVASEFMQEFMHEMRVAFPKLLMQFENFSTDNTFLYPKNNSSLPSYFTFTHYLHRSS